MVPGHEIIGRVTAVGRHVTKFKVGDIGGVGCMVDSCGTCVECLNDREHACLNGMTLTYAGPDKVSGGVTYGGYSTGVEVTEKFVIRIPPGANLAGMAPLLSGITTFSPLQHWKASRGQKIGVIGLGGLGHMAVKLAVARGITADVELIRPGQIDQAFERVVAKDVKFRFVIDMGQA